MATKNSVELLGTTSEEVSKGLDAGRTINWYPVLSQFGKSRIALFPFPGTELFSADLSNVVLRNPLIYDQGKLWCPGYTGGEYSICTIASDGSINIGKRLTTGSLWELGQDATQNRQRIFMVAAPTNTTTYPASIVWQDKSNVNSNGIITIGNYVEPLTATNYAIRPNSIEEMDDYLIFNHVSINTGGGTAYTPVRDPVRGSFFCMLIDHTSDANTAASIADNRMYYMADTVNRILKCGGYLYLFGEKHYEIWFNSGADENFPFEPIKEATQEVGLAHHAALCKWGTTLFFIGKSANGTFGVYSLNGLTLEKISTPAIDQIINKTLPAFEDTTEAGSSSYYNPLISGAFSYTLDGHIFIVFKIEKLVDDGNGPTNEGHLNNTHIVYDLTTKLWSEWCTFDQYGLPLAHFNGSTSGYNNDTIILLTTGELVKTNTSIQTAYEGLTQTNIPIKRTRITRHVNQGDKYVFHNRLRLDIQANSAITYDSNVNANIYLYHSDNDGKTWLSDGVKSFNNVSYGNISGDKRIEWFRLGRSDDRLYKIETNATCPVYLIDSWLDADVGYR